MLTLSAVLYFTLTQSQFFHEEGMGSQHASICLHRPVALICHFKYEEVEVTLLVFLARLRFFTGFKNTESQNHSVCKGLYKVSRSDS